MDLLEDPVPLCLLVGAGPAHAKEVVKIPQLPEKQKNPHVSIQNLFPEDSLDRGCE